MAPEAKIGLLCFLVRGWKLGSALDGDQPRDGSTTLRRISRGGEGVPVATAMRLAYRPVQLFMVRGPMNRGNDTENLSRARGKAWRQRRDGAGHRSSAGRMRDGERCNNLSA